MFTRSTGSWYTHKERRPVLGQPYEGVMKWMILLSTNPVAVGDKVKAVVE
ncbi:MAG: hypothetical protein IPL27_19240 [Lewinellaceae bacterium]|nr:hypothetical protein [Lewinellaceae bacterium]